MRNLKLIFWTLIVGTSLNSCINNAKQTTDIEGLWISTEETSWEFLSGIQKAVFQIKQNQSGALGANGFFLWNDDYQSEWKFNDIQYDKLTHAVKITDADGNIYSGVLDSKNKIIMGAVHLKNEENDAPGDSLNLIPADKNLETKLFNPRTPDRKGQITYSYKMPERLDDGLQTASIYNDDMKPDSMINIVNKIINQEYGRLESLLILKDNKLIVEEYFYGYDQSQLHTILSGTKSVTSLLLGIALDHHKNINVDQSIFNFFPEYDSLKTKEKEQITLKNILTMTAGLAWHEYPREMYEATDQAQYVLSRPMEAKPGEKFLYNSGLAVLTGDIIAQLEGEDVKAFADQYLFNPLEITDYEWKMNKKGKLEFWNGLQMKPRDMAKIGLLVLNNGKWEDKQIVSGEWISESIKPNITMSDKFDYGFGWWIRNKNTKQWWNDPETTDEHDMVVALGTGSQYIIIVKGLNIVVVTTGSNYGNNMGFSVFPMVIKEIIPALVQ